MAHSTGFDPRNLAWMPQGAEHHCTFLAGAVGAYRQCVSGCLVQTTTPERTLPPAYASTARVQDPRPVILNLRASDWEEAQLARERGW